MFRNKDVLLIRNVDSRCIDQMIVILKEGHEQPIPEEQILHQAEKIVKNYVKKQSMFQPSPRKSAVSRLVTAGLLLSIFALLLYQRFLGG